MGVLGLTLINRSDCTAHRQAPPPLFYRRIDQLFSKCLSPHSQLHGLLTVSSSPTPGGLFSSWAHSLLKNSEWRQWKKEKGREGKEGGRDSPVKVYTDELQWPSCKITNNWLTTTQNAATAHSWDPTLWKQGFRKGCTSHWSGIQPVEIFMNWIVECSL